MKILIFLVARLVEFLQCLLVKIMRVVGPKNKTLVLVPEVAPKYSHVRQVYCRAPVGKYEMSFIHITLQ